MRASGAAASAASQLPSIEELNRGALSVSNAASSVNSDDAAAGASNVVDAMNSAGLDATSVPPELLYAGLGVIGALHTIDSCG